MNIQHFRYTSTSTYKINTLAQSCHSRKNEFDKPNQITWNDSIRNLEQLTAYSSGVNSSEGGARKFNNSQETSKQELHNSNTKFDVLYSLFAKISLVLCKNDNGGRFWAGWISWHSHQTDDIWCFLNFSTNNNVKYFVFFFLLRFLFRFRSQYRYDVENGIWKIEKSVLHFLLQSSYSNKNYLVSVIIVFNFSDWNVCVRAVPCFFVINSTNQTQPSQIWFLFVFVCARIFCFFSMRCQERMANNNICSCWFLI